MPEPHAHNLQVPRTTLLTTFLHHKGCARVVQGGVTLVSRVVPPARDQTRVITDASRYDIESPSSMMPASDGATSSAFAAAAFPAIDEYSRQ